MIAVRVVGEKDESRELTWTTTSSSSSSSSSSSATADAAAAESLAAGLERAVQFLGREMGLEEPTVQQAGIARAVGGVLWPPVASAVVARWLSVGAAAAGEAGVAVRPPLDDNAVDALCASEGAAASLGLVPGPAPSSSTPEHLADRRDVTGTGAPSCSSSDTLQHPQQVQVWPGGALGPIEAAAFERERAEADGRRVAVLAEARSIIMVGNVNTRNKPPIAGCV